MKNYFLRLLTESLNALPAENLTVLAAAIFNGSPVLGLRPIRAARLPDAKVPKDRKSTRLNSSHVKRSRMPSSA